MSTAEKINEITKIMNTFDEETLNRYFEMAKREVSNKKVVAYTVEGEPLTISTYQGEIQKGIDDINQGRSISDNDLASEIETW